MTKSALQPKIVIIPIGLPGSGKSTFANTIKETAGYEVAVHSTDALFTDASGNYNFDRDKLPEYHQRNFQNFEVSLAAGVPIVIIDNTNLMLTNRIDYVRAAEAHGYKVQMVIVGEFSEAAMRVYAKRNRHGVSYDEIKLMADEADIPKEAF